MSEWSSTLTARRRPERDDEADEDAEHLSQPFGKPSGWGTGRPCEVRRACPWVVAAVSWVMRELITDISEERTSLHVATVA